MVGRYNKLSHGVSLDQLIAKVSHLTDMNIYVSICIYRPCLYVSIYIYTCIYTYIQYVYPITDLPS